MLSQTLEKRMQFQMYSISVDYRHQMKNNGYHVYLCESLTDWSSLESLFEVYFVFFFFFLLPLYGLTYMESPYTQS